jgi:hypothetical protein
MFIPSRIGRFALADPVFARNLERVGIRQILQFEMIKKCFSCAGIATHINCRVTAGLATIGKPERPWPKVGEPTDGRSGQAVSNKLDLSQLELRQAICKFWLGSPDKKSGKLFNSPGSP